MSYKSKRRSFVRRTNKRTQRKQRRQKAQRRSQRRRKQMKGGVNTPLFGDESIIEETNTHVLDDSDITPPFETNNTDYGETTTESMSNDSSLGFGGKKMQRKKRQRTRKLQRGRGFTMTEETNPESYDDDYEKNLANMEEIIMNA